MFRRAFLSRLSATTAFFAAGQPPLSQPPSTPTTSSQPPASPPSSTAKVTTGPARHAQDEWLDHAPEKHRVVFDTWMADKFGDAMAFPSTWVRINKEQYGLSDADLAVVIVARHGTGPFAFNEAMWTKYGKFFADRMSANDKAAHPNPTTNIHASRLANLTKQGVRLAVCNLTTRAYAQMIARETGAEMDEIYKELTTNAIGEAHFVPAGIVAVTRAQERGYALVSIG